MLALQGRRLKSFQESRLPDLKKLCVDDERMTHM